MFGCLFDLFGGWIINLVAQTLWFILSSLGDLTASLWRRGRTKQSARRHDAILRQQQKQAEETRRQASPFAHEPTEPEPPQFPPSQSPFAPTRPPESDSP